MDARVQRRIQRAGWDLAAESYEPLWQAQLAPVQAALLARAAPRPGEQVLDVACGPGTVSLQAAAAVGPLGSVTGVDLSQRMVDAAREAAGHGPQNTHFSRMDAEQLGLADARFDLVMCSLGLMYLPDPAAAVHEMKRVLRPGGRMVLSVWGERARCGWAPLFGIVDAEVASDVCPLFFGLGRQDSLARLCERAGLAQVRTERLATTLAYADGDEACRAAFVGGPVALAWSRFGAEVRERVQASYLASIEPWRQGDAGYSVPAEFVVVSASLPVA